MTTNEIIGNVLKRITNDGYIARRGRHLYGLGTTLSLGPSIRATVRNSIATVRYRSLPERDAVIYLFQVRKRWNGRNPLSPGDYTRYRVSWMRHEIWICGGDCERYYFIPEYVIGNFCSRPGSYLHEDYDPVHQLMHVNTETHQCCYTGKCLDFSGYYWGCLDKKSLDVYAAASC